MMKIKTRKQYMFFLLCCFSMHMATAQKVTGRVVDESGNSISAATITSNAQPPQTTVSGEDGSFSILVGDGENSIAISAVGFVSKIVNVPSGSSDVGTIRLQQLGIDLEELVVTGYTKQSKSSVTGSVSVVDMKDVRDMPDGNALRAIQGRVTGVQVGKTGGPGGTNTVRIRGYSNVSTNDPLYVIDGIPTQDGGVFNSLNPEDIESMQVLKDASSAAIYGSRANNGVIIITTKSGSKARGKTEMSVNYNVGIQTARKEAFPTFLNPSQYGDWLWERQKNAGKTPSSMIYGNGSTPVIPTYFYNAGATNDLSTTGVYNLSTNAVKQVNQSGTNWLDEIFRNTAYHNINVSVAKSADKSNFYFSGGYYKNDGILKYTGFDRLSARVNSSFKVNRLITVGQTLTVAYSTLSGGGLNQNEDGPIFMAMRINPIIPVYDIAGNFAGTSGKELGNASNPLASLYRDQYDETKTLRALGSAYINFDFSRWIKGLGVEVRANLDYAGVNVTNFTAKALERSEPQTSNFFTEENNTQIQRTYTGIINYSREFKKHRISLLGGIEQIEQSYRMFNATRYDYVVDDIDYRYLNAGGASGQLNGGNGYKVGLFSMFFKGDYAYDKKYFITAILRNDESSRFLGSNRSRLFPSVGGAWTISEENFMKNVKAVQNLKLRVSWGQTGNQATTLPYPAYGIYGLNTLNNNYPIGGSVNTASTGYATSQDGNANLRWEVVTSTDVGLEASLLDNRLTFEAGYYHKKTEDMLVQVPRAGTAGLGINPWLNVGSMLNEGVELGLNYKEQFKNGFHYAVGVNFSKNVNTVTKLLDNEDAFIVGRTLRGNQMSRTSVGRPISYFYGYIIDPNNRFYKTQAEVNQYKQPEAVVGGFRYVDVNGDGVIDASDRTMIGSALPDFIYGINASFGFKHIELTLFFEGQQGNKIYNQARFFSDFDNFTSGALNTRVLQSEGKVNNASVPLNSASVSAAGQSFSSTYFVEDASFLRLRNVQLSYYLGEQLLKVLGIQALKLYVAVENAFVITNYSGLDPEVNIPTLSDNRDENFNLGVDQGAYPNPRTFIFGISLKL